MTALAKYEAGAVNGPANFPPEAYGYTDDVTTEAVKILRDSALKQIDEDEWELIDGFGNVSVS